MPCPRNSKPPELVRALLEDVDERPADDLALLLGIGDSRQAIEEELGRIDEVERKVQLVAKPLLNLVGFVVAQQSVVHEDAREPIANCAMNQHRRHRGVHAAGQSAHDLSRRDLLTNPRGRFLDERADRPVARAAALAVGKIAQDLDAVLRVHDLRVEQQRIQLPIGRFHRHDWRRRARGCHRNPGGTAPTSSP